MVQLDLMLQTLILTTNIYDVINGNATELQVEVVQIDRDDSLEPFKQWKSKMDRVQY
jgi:guanine deaminase